MKSYLFHKKIVKLICLILVALVQLQISLQHYSGILRLHFLSVGQGDAILIESPDGKTLLIDGGPDASVLSELSNVIGVKRKKIDVILLTHPDSDHVNGFLPLLEKYDVDLAIVSLIEPPNLNYSNFLDKIESKNIQLMEPNEYTDFRLGCCVDINLLWPKYGYNYGELGKTNNLSTSLEIKYKNFNAFFAGDIDSKFEDQIAIHSPINIDILKVTHHGSLTSTSEVLLERLEPELAIISVGRNNNYGHPKKEILERLESRNINTLLTSQEGSIEIQTDGLSMWRYR